MVGDSLCYSYYISCEDVSYSVPFLFLHIFPISSSNYISTTLYGYINYQISSNRLPIFPTTHTQNTHYIARTHTDTEHVIIEQLHIVSCSILSPHTRVCTT